MDKVKQWAALTGVVVLAVLAAGWFLLVSPERAQASDLQSQAAAQQSAAAALQTQLAVLKAQAKDLPKQQAKLAAVEAKIPSEPAMPALIRALTAAATASGVEFVSLVPGAPTPVDAAAATTPAAAGAAPTAAGGSAGTLSAIPVAINVIGGYYEVEQYVAALEDLSRAFRLVNLSIAPGTSSVAGGKTASAASATDGKSLATTITGQVFLAVNSTPSAAVTVPAGASPTGSAAPAAPAN